MNLNGLIVAVYCAKIFKHSNLCCLEYYFKRAYFIWREHF